MTDTRNINERVPAVVTHAEFWRKRQTIFATAWDQRFRQR